MYERRTMSYRKVQQECSESEESEDDGIDLDKKRLKQIAKRNRKFERICRMVFSIMIMLALITSILYAIIASNWHSSSGRSETNNSFFSVDCFSNENNSEEICVDRGCKWVSVDDNDEKTPQCFYPNGYGYQWIEKPKKTDFGYEGNLKRTVQKHTFGSEANIIELQIFEETSSRLRIKILDPNNTRYEVPIPLADSPKQAAVNSSYDISFENDPQFGIKITRKLDNTVILDTNVPGLIFSDQYLQISTKLSSKNIYGLGEHRTVEYRHSTDWKKWSFFARDEAPMQDSNLYGVHPFYMNLEDSGNANGVFFHNSNAMQVELQPYPAITFRTTGGILDFFVFLGPTPEDVVKQYVEVIGKPAFPPYWGLGFQMSRWGYHNLSTFQATIERNVAANISLDVMYLDLDYAKEKMMFTYDEVNFGELPNYLTTLHAENRKLVILLDPAIPANESMTENYNPLQRGKEMDIFIKHNGSFLEGEVWPGLTHFPDFTHRNATSYWTTECEDFHKTIQFDGLWVDMNEPASFIDGSVNGCEKNNWNYPPFTAGVLGSEKSGKLFEKTICMDATQELGLHYNLHSLYGHYHANATYHALQTIFPNKRPFIIGRSTYSGTSQYAGHWLGDNRSWWDHLRDSIPGIMEFSIFGFPMIGADICGFFDNTTEELCMRWMQLGAFYTFSRNHNGFDNIEQDPVAMGEKVVKAAVQALRTRYSLLPYLYTLFYLAHTKGSTVIRPILHEFPTDPETWDINDQFLWGSSLLISPAVKEKQTIVNAYFPSGIWYDFYNGTMIKQDGEGKKIDLEASPERVNLHVRGGSILPLQEPSLTTVESRKNPMKLLIAPDENGTATGSMYWDDGESLDYSNLGSFLMLQFHLSTLPGIKSYISMNMEHNNYTDPNNLAFEEILVFNQPLVLNVTINDEVVDSLNFYYDTTMKSLQIKNQKLMINQGFNITMEYSNSS